MAKESNAQAAHDDIATLSFEAAVAELEALVRKLEGGQGALESAIADYTRGVALKDHCVKKLEAAKLQLETIGQKADGALATQPLTLAE